MSLRDLVEPECGGSNALMRLGNQITRDAAFKEEGIGIGRSSNFSNRQQFDENQLVNEFLGQISAPPQVNKIIIFFMIQCFKVQFFFIDIPDGFFTSRNASNRCSK